MSTVDEPPRRADPVPDPAAHAGGGLLGQVIGPVEVGPIAHGGHCVARYEGRVIFVRHAIPGERVMVSITDAGKERFWRGDAVEILEPSPDRVVPPCPIARPGACGGCDFQHIALDAQRRLKAEVLAEQLQRLAGLDLAVPVEAVPVPGATGDDGLSWRSRMRYLIDDDGRPGLRAHRSHRVIPLPVDGCRIAARPIARPSAGAPGTDLLGIAAADGVHWLGRAGTGAGKVAGAAVTDEAGETGPPATSEGAAGTAPEMITERAIGRTWRLAADGFWQVHPAAADVLVTAVLDGLAPEPGETAFDLYCGVGLFAGALVDAGCRVTGVESSRAAVAAARRNLADAGNRARFTADRVDRALRRPGGRGALPRRTDLVVLDPPRTGAGREVIDRIVDRRPRAIAYVACDPAALARDLGRLLSAGYELTSLRAFDLFPMTQHLEAVAILEPVEGRPGR